MKLLVSVNSSKVIYPCLFDFLNFEIISFPVLALIVCTYSFTRGCKVEQRLEPVNQSLEADALEHLVGEEVDSLVPIVTCQIFIFCDFLSQQLTKIYFHQHCA